MMTYPFSLYRGDTYRWRFLLWADAARTTAVDLTDVIVAAEIRVTTGATPITTLACTVTLPNQIDVGLTAAACALLPTAAQWDLQLTYLSGDVQTVVSGSVSVRGDVTGSVPIAAVARG